MHKITIILSFFIFFHLTAEDKTNTDTVNKQSQKNSVEQRTEKNSSEEKKVPENNDSERKNYKQLDDMFNTDGFDFFKKEKSTPEESTTLSTDSIQKGPLTGMGLKALVRVSKENFFAVLQYEGKDYFVRARGKLQVNSKTSSALYIVQSISLDGVELSPEDSDTTFMVQ